MVMSWNRKRALRKERAEIDDRHRMWEKSYSKEEVVKLYKKKMLVVQAELARHEKEQNELQAIIDRNEAIIDRNKAELAEGKRLYVTLLITCIVMFFRICSTTVKSMIPTNFLVVRNT